MKYDHRQHILVRGMRNTYEILNTGNMHPGSKTLEIIFRTLVCGRVREPAKAYLSVTGAILIISKVTSELFLGWI